MTMAAWARGQHPPQTFSAQPPPSPLAQFEAAKRLLDQAAATDQPILIVRCALLETEWVLRSRYRLDKAAIAMAFGQLLECRGVTFEHEPTVEEACICGLSIRRPTSRIACSVHGPGRMTAPRIFPSVDIPIRNLVRPRSCRTS